MRTYSIFRKVICILLFATLIPGIAVAQRSVNEDRDVTGMIAQHVADVLQKNFYDPQMKGVDWKKALVDAESRINATDRVGEMYGAIDEMVRRLDDSHTSFIPPMQTSQPRFGFQMKPFGNVVRIYKIQEPSPAAKAGLKLGDTIVGIDGIPADREHYVHTLYYYRFTQPEEVMDIVLLIDGKPRRIMLQGELPVRSAAVQLRDTTRFWDRVREEEILDEETPFQSERYDDIGYVKIPNFRTDRAERALGKMKDARALIVDLS